MFEALRGLRDAIAPESGNLGGGGGQTKDLDDLWHAYHRGELPDIPPNLKRDEFVRLRAKTETEKDTALVMKFANNVLEKSRLIDEQVESLPGMQRTRAQQMQRIHELVEANNEIAQELEDTYAQAKSKRETCRDFLRNCTSEALGIEEEPDSD